MSNRTLVHAERLGAYRIEIHTDEHAESPRRDRDNLGTLAFVRNCERDGDETISQEDVDEMLTDSTFIALPVYIYSHSGVRFSTKPFGDRWDSGRIGCIYVTREKARREGFEMVNPAQFAAVASREAATGLTIQRKRSLPVLADAGTPYAAITPYLVALATGHEFTEPAILPEGAWALPAGAYGESCGPT